MKIDFEQIKDKCKNIEDVMRLANSFEPDVNYEMHKYLQLNTEEKYDEKKLRNFRR